MIVLSLLQFVNNPIRGFKLEYLLALWYTFSCAKLIEPEFVALQTIGNKGDVLNSISLPRNPIPYQGPNLESFQKNLPNGVTMDEVNGLLVDIANTCLETGELIEIPCKTERSTAPNPYERREQAGANKVTCFIQVYLTAEYENNCDLKKYPYQSNLYLKEQKGIFSKIIKAELKTTQHCVYNIRNLTSVYQGFEMSLEDYEQLNNCSESRCKLHLARRNEDCEYCRNTVKMLFSQPIPQEGLGLSIMQESKETLPKKQPEGTIAEGDDKISKFFGSPKQGKPGVGAHPRMIKFVVPLRDEELTFVTESIERIFNDTDMVYEPENLRKHLSAYNDKLKSTKKFKFDHHAAMRVVTDMNITFLWQSIYNTLYENDEIREVLNIGGSPHRDEKYYSQMEKSLRDIVFVTTIVDGLYDTKKFQDSLSNSGKGTTYSELMTEDGTDAPSVQNMIDSKYIKGIDKTRESKGLKKIRNVYFKKTTKDKPCKNHLVCLNYLDYNSGIAYAQTKVEQYTKKYGKLRSFPVLLTTIDSDYYPDAMDFIRAIFDVCSVLNLLVHSRGHNRVYSPSDLKIIHYDVHNQGKWSVSRRKNRLGTTINYQQATTRGPTRQDYTHPVEIVDIEAMRNTFPISNRSVAERKQVFEENFVKIDAEVLSTYGVSINDVIGWLVSYDSTDRLSRRYQSSIPVAYLPKTKKPTSAIAAYTYEQSTPNPEPLNEFSDNMKADNTGIESTGIINFADTVLNYDKKTGKTLLSTGQYTKKEMADKHCIERNLSNLQRCSTLEKYYQKSAQDLIIKHYNNFLHFENLNSETAMIKKTLLGCTALVAGEIVVRNLPGNKSLIGSCAGFAASAGKRALSGIWSGFKNHWKIILAAGLFGSAAKDVFGDKLSDHLHKIKKDVKTALRLPFTGRRDSYEDLLKTSKYPIRQMMINMLGSEIAAKKKFDEFRETAEADSVNAGAMPVVMKSAWIKLWDLVPDDLVDLESYVQKDDIAQGETDFITNTSTSINLEKFGIPTNSKSVTKSTVISQYAKSIAWLSKNFGQFGSRLEFYKNLGALSNLQKQQSANSTKRSMDNPEVQIRETRATQSVGGCEPVVVEEEVQKDIMNFHNEGQVYMDYSSNQIKNPYPSNCKSFQCYSEVSQIQGKGSPMPISIEAKYRELMKNYGPGSTEKSREPTLLAFESPLYLVKVNPQACFQGQINRHLSVRTKTDLDVRDRCLEDFIRYQRPYKPQTPIKQSFDDYIDGLENKKGVSYQQAMHNWSYHGYPEWKTICSIFQKTKEVLHDKNKIRSRIIGDNKARACKGNNKTFIDPKLHKAACGWTTKILVSLQKKTLYKAREASGVKMIFATALSGDELNDDITKQIREQEDNTGEETVFVEQDVEKMDACCNQYLREMDVVVQEEFQSLIEHTMGLPKHAFETIMTNIKKIDNFFEYSEYKRGKKIIHVKGQFSGTTSSGWPFMTTFGNTCKMLILALAISRVSNTRDLIAAVSGDNLVLCIPISAMKVVREAIRTLTCARNIPIKHGQGLIIGEIAFSRGSTTFLSKMLFPGHAFTRAVDRLAVTANYTFSKQADTEEGKAVMRNCVSKQLALTGGDNPALGGYLIEYNKQEQKAGKVSNVEARENEMKIFNTAQKCNYQPYLNLIHERGEQIMTYNTNEHYYKNLKTLGPHNEISDTALVGGAKFVEIVEPAASAAPAAGEAYNVNKTLSDAKLEMSQVPKTKKANKNRGKGAKLNTLGYKNGWNLRQIQNQNKIPKGALGNNIPQLNKDVVTPAQNTIAGPVMPHKAEHHKKKHPKHQHDHFEKDLEHAIINFEGAKTNYSNTLLYPEVSMSRIPFICPVPTALARGVSIYTIQPDLTQGDTFAWSFIPEAILSDIPNGHYPFTYASANSSVNDIPTNGPASGSMTKQQLFPNIQFDSIDSMRVVGASLTVTQTQRLVDRSGYGMMSRVYGQASNGYIVSKSAVLNATYKDEANFTTTDGDDHLRMIYAPGDFTDLHMVNIHHGVREGDQEKFPVLQGFVTGYGTVQTAITFEFNVVIEYVPKPILYQMVERKPVEVNSNHLSKAENLAARVDTGISSNQLAEMRAVSDMPIAELKETVRNAGPNRGDLLKFLNGFGRTAMSFLPTIRTIGSLASILAKPRMNYAVMLSTEAMKDTNNGDQQRAPEGLEEWRSFPSDTRAGGNSAGHRRV